MQDTSQQHLGSQPPGSFMSSTSRSKNSSPIMYLASTAAWRGRGAEAGWRKPVKTWKGPCLPLTIHVIPGQILEGLIEQDDGQRHLKHHPPLPTTQWGHLENELVGSGRPVIGCQLCICVSHPDSNGPCGNVLPSHLHLRGFCKDTLSLAHLSLPWPCLLLRPGSSLSERAPPFLSPEGEDLSGG